MEVIGVLVVGLLAGWLAALLVRGRGLGCLGNMLLGLVGAVLGGFVFQALGVEAGGAGGLLFTAFLGAALLLFIVGLLTRR